MSSQPPPSAETIRLLVDTHAHLVDAQFADDLVATLRRAQAAGVGTVLCIGTTSQDSASCLDLARRHPSVRATIGLQPNNIAQEPPDCWERLLRLASDANVVAIGETGLDRYLDHTPFEVQERYFGLHIDLARQWNLPLVIHCRDAEADVVRMLRAEFDARGAIRGVMHSFAGSQATAEECLALGLHISFSGMLTYKNADNLRQVAARVPLDRLLVETDSPYLAPVPCRGKRNEPAFVVHTAARLAEIRGVSLEAISTITTKNAIALFDL